MTLLYDSPQLTVHLISDGTYRTDGGAMFGLVPKPLWEPLVPADERNRILMALNCLLIRDGGTRILVDTGYGTKVPEKQRAFIALDGERPGLLGDLAALGLAAEDISVVLNTHLHADHCGGNTIVRGGYLEATFPEATYMVQRIEWSEALFPNERTRATYLHENLDPIAPQVELLNGDTRISPHVRTWVTRGHTASHQCVVVEPPGEPPLVFLADLAPRRVHLERLAWIPAVDVLPLDSLETKRAVARWLVESQALCVLQHEPETPVGRLTEGSEGFRWVPEGASAAD